MTLDPQPIAGAPYVPAPEVYELYGDEALMQWLAVHTSMYKSQEERAFAATATMPLEL